MIREDSITVSNSAVGLTKSNLITTPPAVKVEVFVEDAQVRFRTDGNDPTSNVGEILNPFDRLIINNMNEAFDFKAIRTGTADATLRVRYKTSKD